MSFIGGYQSDVNLNDINFVGDFPIDHSIGGFGVTTEVNNYLLVLSPSIAQYRPGLPLAVRFSLPNTGAATINVDGRGVKAIKKIVAGVLVDLEANDLTDDKIYILIYDGNVFQIANSSHLLLDATEARKGISQIATVLETFSGVNDSKFITPAKLIALINTLAATQEEVDEGVINNKAVTPLTLANYIADKITGLWEDKGVFSGAGNPNYPAGQVGDAYTVNIPGKVGGAFGQNIGVRDVIYCNTDNPGGDEENVGFCWTIIQANLEAATELVAGYIRVATQAEVNAGANNSTAVSPLKLKTLLDIRNATEALTGLAEIATQAETNAGIDDGRIVTPLKLVTWFALQLATEVQAGISERATQAEVNAGLDDVRYVSPLKLTTLLNSVVQQATELIKGIAEIATQAEADAGADDTRIITPLKLQVRLNNYINRESIHLLAVANVNPNFFYTPGRNQIALINGNLVIVRDFRFKPNSVPVTVNTHVLNFPKPVTPGAGFAGILHSNLGQQFMYSIDSSGRVSLFGTFNAANDELLFNINPYVAKFPLEFHPTQPPS